MMALGFLKMGTRDYKLGNVFAAPMVGFGLLFGGMIEGFLSQLVVATRNYLAYKRKKMAGWFILLSIALFFWLSPLSNWWSFLPIVSVTIMTLAYFYLSELNIKKVIVLSNLTWMTFFFLEEAWLPLVFESMLFASIILFWTKELVKKRDQSTI